MSKLFEKLLLIYLIISQESIKLSLILLFCEIITFKELTIYVFILIMVLLATLACTLIACSSVRFDKENYND